MYSPLCFLKIHGGIPKLNHTKVQVELVVVVYKVHATHSGKPRQRSQQVAIEFTRPKVIFDIVTGVANRLPIV